MAWTEANFCTLSVCRNRSIARSRRPNGRWRFSGYWKAFSPLHNVRPGHAPTLNMLGTRDALIPVATGQAYCDKVRETGSSCRLELYEGQPHAFFSRTRSKLYYGKTLAAMDAFLTELGYLGTRAD